MSVEQVASQLWGTASPSPLRGEDMAQLGPAPRALEERMAAYARRAVHTLAPVWLMLAIFFGLGDAIGFAVAGWHPPVLAVVFTLLTVHSFRARGRMRARVLDTLRHGAFFRVPVSAMRAVERRGRYGRVLYVTYHVTFDLPHGAVTLVTRDAGVSILQVGLREEVLWSERCPEVVVPTYLLAT
jgi:hypothetical protein